MARIDDNGLIFSEPGDIVKVEQRLRVANYGALIEAKPEILIHHLTGNRIPFGANDSAHDGTQSMVGRIFAGAAKFYASAYLGRDGVLWQVVPFVRAAIHVAGKWNGKEVNRISNGIEVTNTGYAHLDGKAPGFTIDPTREDFRQHGNLIWHMLTEPQNSAIIEIADAWRRWTGAAVEDCLRGHHDVDTDSSHIDPGPELRALLDGPVKAHLEAMAL